MRSISTTLLEMAGVAAIIVGLGQYSSGLAWLGGGIAAIIVGVVQA